MSSLTNCLQKSVFFLHVFVFVYSFVILSVFVNNLLFPPAFSSTLCQAPTVGGKIWQLVKLKSCPDDVLLIPKIGIFKLLFVLLVPRARPLCASVDGLLRSINLSRNGSQQTVTHSTVLQISPLAWMQFVCNTSFLKTHQSLPWLIIIIISTSVYSSSFCYRIPGYMFRGPSRQFSQDKTLFFDRKF